MIFVGTSGYSFDDWQGVFYPPGLPRGQRLNFYTRHFPAVEVNSTYYRLPHPMVLRQMERKTPDGFRFLVKLNQEVTHRGCSTPEHFHTFLDAISPLEEVGKFYGALAQFPWGFKRTPRNIEHLGRIRERMGERPVFVEFRHDSWACEETFALLKDLGLGFCAVDEPKLRGLFPPIVRETNGVGYVRFHGRNAQNWWGRGGGDRYDYDYSDSELRGWVEMIQELGSMTTDTYLFFNNCHAGRAAQNALRMEELLGLDSGE
jgi:uncharacterized protein YecE (DUF72 family)